MKKYFNVVIAFFITTIIVVGCGNNKPSKSTISNANEAIKPCIAMLNELECVNYDSLYRATPYKEWKKIDSLVYGVWYVDNGKGANLWEGYSKLSAIKERIDIIANWLYDDNYDNDALTHYRQIKGYSYRAEDLHKKVAEIRTKVLKTKNKKAYNKQLKEDKKRREEITRFAVAAYKMQENERAMKEVRKQYKETYTITQTPYGTAVSVSYTKK